MEEEEINQKYKHKYHIGKSTIEGNGLFASELIQKHHPVGIAIYFKMYIWPSVTYMGSYINHSKKNANVKLVYFNNKYYLIAIKDIEVGSEILIDYDGKYIPFYIMPSLWYYKD